MTARKVLAIAGAGTGFAVGVLALLTIGLVLGGLFWGWLLMVALGIAGIHWGMWWTCFGLGVAATVVITILSPKSRG